MDLYFEIVSSCSNVKFEDRDFTKIEMTRGDSLSDVINLFDYTLEGYDTPSCGDQSWVLDLDQNLAVTITEEGSTANTIFIDTVGLTEAGTITFKITATLKDHPLVTKVYSMSVVVEEPIADDVINYPPAFESYDNWKSPSLVSCG